MPALPWILACFSLFPQDPAELVQRWQAHYAAAGEELRRHEPADLDPGQRARRRQLLEALDAYRRRADFPRLEQPGAAWTPCFVDRAGRRCAVAELLHRGGRGELVERVRRSANAAWVVELAGEAEFRAWLAENGLTLEEAARIQTPTSYTGGGDTVPPPEPPPPAAGPRPLAGPPIAPQPGPAPVAPSASSESAASSEAWWMWWEFNKLVYLSPRGLEERLRDERGLSRGQIASLTEPLRRVRGPLVQAALRDPDARVRASAALALGRIGGEAAVEPLVALLADPSQRVREHALFGLGAGGTSAGAQVLLGLLERGGRRGAERELVTPRALPLAILALAVGRRAGMDPAVAGAVARWAPRVSEVLRADALWAACVFQRIAPDPALESLALDLVRAGEAPLHVRAAAVEALGGSPDPAVLARLQDVLFGRELELRRSAALALGRSPQALATAALLTACELEAEPLARGFALLALGMRGGAPARDLLLEAFARGPLASEPWAALGLGLHARVSGDPRIARALLEAVPRTRNRDSRPAVLLALGLAREPGAAALARTVLEFSASPRERGYAATTLALLGGEANRVTLRERLALERSGFVRATLTQALAVSGADADAGPLFAALGALADPGLQAVTAASIGQLGSPDSLSALDELARAADSTLVRATALDGLGVLLERDEPLILPEASRDANFALYPDWVLQLFLVAL